MRVVILMAALAAGPAWAEMFGTWTVTQEGTGDDRLCVAEGRDGGDSFRLLKDALTPPFEEFESDDGLPGAAGPAEMVFEVDDARWALDGVRDGDRISARLGDPADFARLTQGIAAGQAMRMTGDSGGWIAEVSLKGGAAAMAAFEACWRGV